MAHSIENRVPFLDNKMLELWSGLQSESLVGSALFRERLTTKMPLKRIAERYFGRDFAYRKKMGFGLPLKEFLASPAFAEIMEDQLLPEMLKRGLIRGDIVKEWWKKLRLLSYSEVECLWICIAFELWALTFLDGNGLRRFCIE
jgi:asparagine synthase (glutamine-hydrolysing)